MDNQPKKNDADPLHSNGEDHLETYGDPGIASYDAKVPRFLIWTYILLPIWGLATWYFFWNGSSVAWFDRGYWKELQIAANTTYPEENQNMPETISSPSKTK